MSLFGRITEARQLLGLMDTASAEEIKSNYRELMKQWHPDHCPNERLREEFAARSRELTEPYELLQHYTGNYRYSFREEDVKEQAAGPEQWRQQFGFDPTWGSEKK